MVGLKRIISVIGLILLISLSACSSQSKYPTLHASLALDIPSYTTPEDQQLINTINSLKPGQRLILYVHSNGGGVIEGNKIISAIDHTKGIVVADCHQWVASMAAILILHCQEIKIADGTLVLYHAMRYEGPLGVEVVIHVPNLEIPQKALEKDILTPKEMSIIYDKDGEVTLTANTLRDRLCSSSGRACPSELSLLKFYYTKIRSELL